MPDREQLQEAKQFLSGRLLRAGLRGGVVGLASANRVRRAIASADRNVHAVGIGRKVVAGRPTKELCVRVYVVQKIADSLLPPTYRIPGEVEGVPTDVIESAPAFLLQAKRKAARRKSGSETAAAGSCTENRRGRQRPIVAGISAAHVEVTAGTIACFCRSTRHGDDPNDLFALSNNHVFANVNLGEVGDSLYQPGPADGGVSGDHFADLHRWVAIRLGGTEPNRVDAAIGRLRPGIEHAAEICTIGPVTGTARAIEGLLVRKHGRTTGYTEGEVTDESYDALVGMDHADPSVVALFENQFRIVRTDPHPSIGLGGDSGSLVVARGTQEAVGLYFAGPASGAYGIANQIEDVLSELEIQLP